MPWNKRTLALPASPPSVRLARDWVTGVLTDIGRPELADSARLAVSELVTNAILHAEPPMTVHVRGTVEHPRIEVTDQSLVPPRPHVDSAAQIDVEDEFSWSTVGRGLDLVASYVVRWGADIDVRGSGKVVWFEPAAEPRESPVDGELFDLDGALADRSAVHDPDELVTIRLLNMPVDLFAHLRQHFNELGRELRLLAISEPDAYPIAVEFTEAYLQVEYERRQVHGLQALDEAMESGRETVDLTYLAPPTAPGSMARISALLDAVYTGLAEHSLLAVRPPRTLLDLQHWYLGEFTRQAAGADPTPWSGPTRMSPRREVS